MARSRCSRPTVSWRRSVANRNARWIVSTVSGAKGTSDTLWLHFHRHEQWELVLLRQLLRPPNLGLGHIMRVDARQPHPRPMHVHHDAECLGSLFLKHGFE